MTIARTEIAVTVQPCVGTHVNPVMEGIVAITDSFDVTASSDTTAAFFCGGAIPLRLINNSGDAAVLTITDAVALNGVANDIKDEDGVAWGPFTLADGESRALPAGGMGVTYAVVTGAAAYSGIRCKLGR